jgi:hypothetical protein
MVQELLMQLQRLWAVREQRSVKEQLHQQQQRQQQTSAGIRH